MMALFHIPLDNNFTKQHLKLDHLLLLHLRWSPLMPLTTMGTKESSKMLDCLKSLRTLFALLELARTHDQSLTVRRLGQAPRKVVNAEVKETKRSTRTKKTRDSKA